MKARLYLVLSIAAALAACAPGSDKPRFNTARAVDAIRADEVAWNADWASGDPTKVVSHFAPEATVNVAGAPPMVGRPAIRAAAQSLMDDPKFAFTFNSDRVEVAQSGDLAVSRGVYKQTLTDPATKTTRTVTGAFVTVYKPQPDGSWKAQWDMATPNPAAPAAAPNPAPPAAPDK